MIHIICFGNTLCSDDGVGYLVFELLEQKLKSIADVDSSVQLFYAANSGQKTLPLLMNCSELILVDAIVAETQKQPGEIHRFTASDIISQLENNKRTEYSSHAFDLHLSWELIETLNPVTPELTIYAIEIDNAQPYREKVSDPVKHAAQLVSQEIVEQCITILKDNQSLTGFY